VEGGGGGSTIEGSSDVSRNSRREGTKNALQIQLLKFCEGKEKTGEIGKRGRQQELRVVEETRIEEKRNATDRGLKLRSTGPRTSRRQKSSANPHKKWAERQVRGLSTGVNNEKRKG